MAQCHSSTYLSLFIFIRIVLQCVGGSQSLPCGQLGCSLQEGKHSLGCDVICVSYAPLGE